MVGRSVGGAEGQVRGCGRAPQSVVDSPPPARRGRTASCSSSLRVSSSSGSGSPRSLIHAEPGEYVSGEEQEILLVPEIERSKSHLNKKTFIYFLVSNFKGTVIVISRKSLI